MPNFETDPDEQDEEQYHWEQKLKKDQRETQKAESVKTQVPRSKNTWWDRYKK